MGVDKENSTTLSPSPTMVADESGSVFTVNVERNLPNSYGTTALNYTKGPTGLFLHLESCEWERAVARCRDRPAEASTWMVRRGYDGETTWRKLPLHEACIRRAPLFVIQCLLRTHMDSVKCADGNARLPLHHACVHGCDPAIVRELLLAHPDGVNARDSWEKTPLAIMESSVAYNDNLQQKHTVADYVRKDPTYWIRVGVQMEAEDRFNQTLEALKKEHEVALKECARKSKEEANRLVKLEEERSRHAQKKIEREGQGALMAEKQRNVRERSDMEHKMETLEEKLAKAREATDERDALLKKAGEENAAQRNEMSDLKHNIHRLETAVSQRDNTVSSLTEKCDGLVGSVQELRQSCDDMKDVVAQTRSVQRLREDEIDRIQKEKKQLGDELSEVISAKDDTIHQLEALVEQLKANALELEENLSEKEDVVADIETAMVEMEEKHREDEDIHLQQSKMLTEELETMQRRLAHKDTLLEAKARAIEERDANVEDLMSRLVEIEGQHKTTEQTCAKRDGALRDSREKCSRLEDHLEVLQKERREMVEAETSWLQRARRVVSILLLREDKTSEADASATTASSSNPPAADGDNVSVITESSLDNMAASKVERIGRHEEFDRVLSQLETAARKILVENKAALAAVQSELQGLQTSLEVTKANHQKVQGELNEALESSRRQADRADASELKAGEAREAVEQAENRVVEVEKEMASLIKNLMAEKAGMFDELSRLRETVHELQEKDRTLKRMFGGGGGGNGDSSTEEPSPSYQRALSTTASYRSKYSSPSAEGRSSSSPSSSSLKINNSDLVTPSISEQEKQQILASIRRDHSSTRTTASAVSPEEKEKILASIRKDISFGRRY